MQLFIRDEGKAAMKHLICIYRGRRLHASLCFDTVDYIVQATNANLNVWWSALSHPAVHAKRTTRLYISRICRDTLKSTARTFDYRRFMCCYIQYFRVGSPAVKIKASSEHTTQFAVLKPNCTSKISRKLFSKCRLLLCRVMIAAVRGTYLVYFSNCRSVFWLTHTYWGT